MGLGSVEGCMGLALWGAVGVKGRCGVRVHGIRFRI